MRNIILWLAVGVTAALIGIGTCHYRQTAEQAPVGTLDKTRF